MTITAKVRCNAAIPTADGEQVSVAFGPDYLSDDGKAVNAEWAKYTPGLSLSMVVLPSVPFEVGKSYTLTFEPEA